MSSFVVSARKYRPIRFDSVVGQQHVSQTLKNAIKSDHLAQAFLFCGPRGVGKTTCARILAKVLNCETPTSDTEPCDTCPSCQAFNENASLNIHELDAASNNSVEHIRALIEQVRFAPQRGRYKIYIIDEVHMLSQAAFNAFLKTLEEPPSYAIFILATTEKHKIIPTILSRCQIFDFNRIQIADMAAHLRKICQAEGIEAEEEALHVIAQKADGALRDALSIYDRIVSFSGNSIRYVDVIDNLNILDYDYYFKVVDAMVTENLTEMLLLFDDIQRKGFEGDIFINGLAEHLRNVLVCQRPETAKLLELSGTIRDRYMEQALLVPTSLILTALNLANDCDINYKLARNKRLHVEMTLVKMVYIMQALRLQQSPLALDGTAQAASNEKKNLPKLEQAPTASFEEEETEEEEEYELPEAKPVLSSTQNKQEHPYVYNIEEELEDEEEEETPAPLPQKGGFLDRLKSKQGIYSSILSEVQEENNKYEKEPSLDWTHENLMSLWNEYILQIESPSEERMFRMSIPTLSKEDSELIEIKVSSNRSKDAIARDSRFLEFLRLKFGKPSLRLLIDLEDLPEQEPVAPKVQKPVSERDKYLYFLKLNPNLAQFQERFDLYPPDFDYKKLKK